MNNQGSLGISATSPTDFQQVKAFITNLNSQFLKISDTNTHEAVVAFSSTAPSPVALNLNSLFTTSDVNNAINAITQAQSSASIYGDRSYTSAIERVRDNVFCRASGCGDRIEAYNVLLFISAGRSTVRTDLAQSTMNNLKARFNNPTFVVTLGVGNPQVVANMQQNLTDYSTCGAYAFFSQASSLGAQLSSIYNVISTSIPGPVFEPSYQAGISGKL